MKKFVTAATYDQLLAAYESLLLSLPTGSDIEATLRKANITPTAEACQAFRIGLNQAKQSACACGGNCQCKDKFGGSI
jgi:hypothetical protein